MIISLFLRYLIGEKYKNKKWLFNVHKMSDIISYYTSWDKTKILTEEVWKEYEEKNVGKWSHIEVLSTVKYFALQ